MSDTFERQSDIKHLETFLALLLIIIIIIINNFRLKTNE